MFGLLKRKKPYEQEAKRLFEAVHSQSRGAVFYEELGVPDTTEGRFSILTLHMFMVMHRLQQIAHGEELSQSLFDVAFEDIDRGYREIGIGDMGIPKRMKKLMLGFNGAIHAYEQGLSDKAALKEALRRNVFTAHIGEEEELSKPLGSLADYIFDNIEHLQSQDEAYIINGEINFKTFKEVK